MKLRWPGRKSQTSPQNPTEPADNEPDAVKITLAPSAAMTQQPVKIVVVNTCDNCGSVKRLTNTNGRKLCAICWAATWKQAK